MAWVSHQKEGFCSSNTQKKHMFLGSQHPAFIKQLSACSKLDTKFMLRAAKKQIKHAGVAQRMSDTPSLIGQCVWFLGWHRLSDGRNQSGSQPAAVSELRSLHRMHCKKDKLPGRTSSTVHAPEWTLHSNPFKGLLPCRILDLMLQVFRRLTLILIARANRKIYPTKTYYIIIENNEKSKKIR